MENEASVKYIMAFIQHERIKLKRMAAVASWGNQLVETGDTPESRGLGVASPVNSKWDMNNTRP